MGMTREEAISAIKATLKEISESEDAVCYLNSEDETWLNMAIQALEQEPRKGHWIMTSDYFTGAYESIDYVKCSCCGEDSLEEGNYCPNCGAEMSEVEE